jgi:hypothetical protein
MTVPNRDRPVVPDGYGIDQADGYVSWDDIEAKLRESRHYWLATTRPDGRPHAVPRWGLWLDGRFWYDGSPDTKHVRNLDRNPECVLHLKSGAEAIILEGKSLQSDPIEGELGERLAAEYARKYGPIYTPSADAWSDEIAGGMRSLVPVRVMAWTEFPRDATRYTF